MNKYNPIRVTDKTDLCEQTKIRLDKISKIEDYFIEEINQQKSCSKRLSKYITIFDYIDKCNIRRNINYLICKRYWNTGWNSKCKPYFKFFSSNWNSKRIILHDKKDKENS